MDWTFNTIWKDLLPQDKLAVIEFKGNKPTTNVPVAVSYSIINKFKTKGAGFFELNGVSSAEYLEVNFSSITSFLEIGKLGRIKRLELCWCLKLESDSGLSEIKDHIEWLHINTSRKFSPKKDLFELRNLKVLCLNACGPLDNLGFLRHMPNLLDFRFVDTNIVDGDLTPILEHPNLVNAGFLDKRHYNLKHSDIEAELRGKWEKATGLAYKGDCGTWRYKAFGV